MDDRSYWGGRIITKSRPRYEVGAARFNNTHTLLLKLIKRYNLTKIPLPLQIDYFHMESKTFEKNTNKVLDDTFQQLVSESSKFSKSHLTSISLYKYMQIVIGNANAKCILNRFGYNSEITKMNAYDALNVFKNDFVNMKYFVLKEGLSSLCNHIVEELKSNGVTLLNKSFVSDVDYNEDKQYGFSPQKGYSTQKK